MARFNQSFDGSPLLSWLPDETLFSLVSRLHMLWGHQLASRTSSILFGQLRGGIHHDLPSCIDFFVQRTGHAFGSALDICTERTLLRYYRRFINQEEEERIVATLRGPSVANLKYRMGLLTSRFRAHHPLKACEQCMWRDRANFGWAYWHSEHQFPGVWVCPEHGNLLCESRVKANGVERFLWHLPTEEQLRLPPIQEPHPGLQGKLARLAELTLQFSRCSSTFRVDLSRLSILYSIQLQKRNLLTVSGRLRLAAIAREFESHVRALRVMPEFAALPKTSGEAYSQLSRYLRAPRTGTHPLRHVLIIDWLFEDFGEFETLYSALPEFARRHGGLPTQASDEDDPMPATAERKLALASLLENTGASVKSTAAALGIDTTTALVWAAQLGISTSRRPKKLKTEIRQALLEKLRAGIDKSEAASEFGVAIGTVTTLLRTTIGLHDEWVQAKFERLKIHARAEWLTLRPRESSLGVKFLRNLCPATYAWLYRNDLPWLRANSPWPSARAPQLSSKRWDIRDEELCRAVEHAALKLSLSSPTRHLKLWQLYQEIPELRAKLGCLDRLPRTIRAIDIALRLRTSQQQHPIDFGS